MLDDQTTEAIRWFPVLWGYRITEQVRDLRSAGVPYLPVAVPWGMLAPHEAQAQRNHSQSLPRLADRGGLSPDEIVAVIENRRWHAIPLPEACRIVCRKMAEWIDGEIDNGE